MKTRLSTQILSFLVVGGLSTLIDFAIVYGLNGILGWHYQLAVLIAFVLATIFNYWASMRFTFESKFSPEQKHQEFLLFLVLSILGLALTAGLMWVAVDAMHWPVMPAKVAVTAIVMVFNFLTRKLLLEK